MSTPRINVDNHLMWGRLVKSWATGRDYVNHNVTDADPVPAQPVGVVPFPKPSSFKDMVTACRNNHVGLHFVATAGEPKTYCTGDEDVGFVLLQGTSEISILRLPAKEKIHESEAALLGAGGQACWSIRCRRSTASRSEPRMRRCRCGSSGSRRRWNFTRSEWVSTRSIRAPSAGSLRMRSVCLISNVTAEARILLYITALRAKCTFHDRS